MTHSRLENKPRTRLKAQFLIQSNTELLSLGSREVPSSSPVHKLVSLDCRKAGPECEITIMEFDPCTKSLNHASRQVSLKRVIPKQGENAGVTLRCNALSNSIHPSHTTSPG